MEKNSPSKKQPKHPGNKEICEINSFLVLTLNSRRTPTFLPLLLGLLSYVVAAVLEHKKNNQKQHADEQFKGYKIHRSMTNSPLRRFAGEGSAPSSSSLQPKVQSASTICTSLLCRENITSDESTGGVLRVW